MSWTLNEIKELPNVEYLRKYFTYKDGFLYFKNYRDRVWTGPDFEGKQAGCFNHGYYVLKIDGTCYFGHRIIWKLLTGQEPKYVIDHIDDNPGNNLFENLRDVDMKINNYINKKREKLTW